MEAVARQLQNWASKVAVVRKEWKKEDRANMQSGTLSMPSKRCDQDRWDALMKKSQNWVADHMKETCTEMHESSMNRIIKVAWNETEKEHRAYVVERIKKTNRKLEDVYRSVRKYLRQWIRQDYQSPITTMKKTSGTVTTNFQEIHKVITESWQPITRIVNRSRRYQCRNKKTDWVRIA